jgi:hypothetical protein
VGFGLSNKNLPLFPICYQLSPSLLNPSSFFLCSTFVTISFLMCGVVSPTPNPQPGGPGYHFLSGSSPLTCLAWEALPVAYATASIALGIMWPHKPHLYVKVGIPSITLGSVTHVTAIILQLLRRNSTFGIYLNDHAVSQPRRPFENPAMQTWKLCDLLLRGRSFVSYISLTLSRKFAVSPCL